MEITSKNQIIDYFSSGCKEDLLIGVENEKFLFREEDQQRVNYSDIKKVLNLYSEKYKWEKIFENKNLIGLKLGGKSITLEPGNQIELSGDKYKNIHGVCSESYDFQSKLNEICKNLKLKTIAVGHDPYSKLSDVPNNPKQRYDIMTKEMPKNGKQSLNMMYQTSGTQINIDYSSEEDFKKKFKVISFLIPITIGIFANSAISENKPSGYLSLRSKVWQETARGGLPEIFLEDMDFEKYADFAINFPLLFLKKNNLYTSANGKKFKDFMEGKIENIKNLPNLGDLELHLSTIFTENRLKKYIEIRSLDACEWDCHCAGPAFLIGLIYGNLESTISIINKWKKEDVLNAYIEAPKKGLNTIINNKKILDWLKIFYDISKNGLEKRKELNKTKRDESIFLNNIKQILNDKKTKADKSLEKL
tara:strand:- start:402 stop:1658 length:1257 start_codon:yes stop_codon:yes gene_type:complete